MTNRLRAVLAGTLRRRDSDEAGQGLAEYALILGLIAVVCIGALSALGVNIATSVGFTAIPAAL
jgi:Flp pilus assembly pilin Flp